ncbi:MAG: 4-hydroxybenzoate octaprenyltransferase, partial [Methylophilus sp.]
MLSFAKWNAYYRLTRLDKPIGIWLLMWPTLWGLLIAGQ